MITLAVAGCGELPVMQVAACAAMIRLPGRKSMSWTAPKIVEVSVGMEINMYACASGQSARRKS
nr:pyrroloquinoline quinone precursor peptide PqqA [Bradyrhizobium aeschynomenes]